MPRTIRQQPKNYGPFATVAVFAGLTLAAIGLCVVVAFALNDPGVPKETGPKPAVVKKVPTCFKHPDVSVDGDGDATQSPRKSEIKTATKRRDETAEELRRASKACLPEKCSGDAREAYLQAVKAYMAGRTFTLASFEAKYAKTGLGEARTIYGLGEDEMLVEGMRERHKTGALDIAAPLLSSMREPTQLIVLKPTSEFKACVTE